MFKETDKTLFVGRLDDGSIYGVWTVKQWNGQEEAIADDPAVAAFNARPIAREAKLADGDLAALLIEQGVITQSAVDARLATDSPITPIRVQT